ncbi:MAG: hypothetical protein J7L54_04825 [Elusimicrobia bacterium]|nr:hypothetical protein [Elusimicrobiota bacterium]
MKKFLFALLAAGLAATPVVAEMKAMGEEHHPEMKVERLREKRHAKFRKRMEKQIKRMKKDLDLNENQVNELERILKDGGKKIAEIRKEMRKKIRAIRIRTDKEIEEILTPQQKEKFREFKKKRRQRLKKRREKIKEHRMLREKEENDKDKNYM